MCASKAPLSCAYSRATSGSSSCAPIEPSISARNCSMRPRIRMMSANCVRSSACRANIGAMSSGPCGPRIRGDRRGAARAGSPPGARVAHRGVGHGAVDQQRQRVDDPEQARLRVLDIVNAACRVRPHAECIDFRTRIGERDPDRVECMQQVAAFAIVEHGRLRDAAAKWSSAFGTHARGEQVADLDGAVVLRAHQQVVRRAAFGRDHVGGAHRAADEFEALQVGILLPVLPDTPQMIVPHSKASSVVTSAKPIWVFCWIVSDRMGYARSRLNENE